MTPLSVIPTEPRQRRASGGISLSQEIPRLDDKRSLGMTTGSKRSLGMTTGSKRSLGMTTGSKRSLGMTRGHGDTRSNSRVAIKKRPQ